MTVSTSHGHTAVIHTTSNHPFWDNTTHTWTAAGKLKPGDQLNSTGNQHPTVLATKATPGAANRWNLTIQQLHTYYVVAGGVPILVHNTDEGCSTVGDATAQETQETVLHGPFHRKSTGVTGTQTVVHAQLQQDSGQLWGGLSRMGGDEAARAYFGPLPEGASGVEFYTTLIPREAFPGQAWWEYGKVPGVILEDDYAKIPIFITKNTQLDG